MVGFIFTMRLSPLPLVQLTVTEFEVMLEKVILLTWVDGAVQTSLYRKATPKSFVPPRTVIPYKKVPREKVKLPDRSKKGAYDDQVALKGRNFVPGKY